MAQMSKKEWQETVAKLADISDETLRDQQLTKTAMEIDASNFTKVSQYLVEQVKAYQEQQSATVAMAKTMQSNAQAVDMTQTQNKAAETQLSQDEKQQALIQQLAAMPVEQAAKTIHEKVSQEVGVYGQEAVATAEHNLAGLVEHYKQEHGLHVTGFADVLVREKVSASMNVDDKGNASYGAAAQARLGKVGDATVLAGGSIGADETGITGGNAWVNVIGEPAKVGPVHVVPVSQAHLNVPANGKLGPGNVTGMVGIVANPEGTQGNIAVLGSATMDGKKANVFADYSHDINLGNHTTITPHVGVTQQLVGGNATSLSGGARIHKTDLFDKTTGGALEVTAGTGNLREKNPGWSVGVQAEVTFNNAEAKKESELEHALMQATGKSRSVDSVQNLSEPALAANTAHHASLSNAQQYQHSADSKPSIAIMQNDAGRQRTTIQPHGQMAESQNDPVGFLNMSHKQQVALVSRMTENYVKEHPAVAPDAARELIVHTLLNPQQSQQQVPELTRG